MPKRQKPDLSSIRMVEAGSLAPDFEACDTGGRVVCLSDYWQDSPVVVVFLRYLGCPFCREQVMALRENYSALRALGAEVVCVAMGGDKVGRAFQVMFNLPYPLLMLDEGQIRPYQQYGLAQAGLMQLFGPRMVAGAFAAIRSLGGSAIDLNHIGNKRQMPGTFVIDKGGKIRLAYRSHDAADNAPVALLLKTVEQIRASAV